MKGVEYWVGKRGFCMQMAGVGSGGPTVSYTRGLIPMGCVKSVAADSVTHVDGKHSLRDEIRRQWEQPRIERNG